MKTLSRLVTLILLCFACQSWAYNPSEGNISLYLGPFLYKTSIVNTVKVPSTPEQVGFGMVLLGDINKNSSLEIGLFVLDKNYYRELGNDYIGEQTQLVHITMGYRRWFSEIFSGSLTFYSAYSMGDIKLLHTDFTPSNNIDTSARDTTEYGFDLALQAEVWEYESNAVVLDLRYSKSVTSKKDEDGDHYGVLIGYRYLLQEKNPGASLK